VCGVGSHRPGNVLEFFFPKVDEHVALLDNVAKMNTDMELDALLGASALGSAIPFYTSMTQRTASATLLNSTRTLRQPTPS
jgi:hypothetical protein